MGSANSKSNLSQSIAEILGTADPASTDTLRHSPGPIRKSLIYSSMALMAINPIAVNAVGLGPITVHSHLGQPLEATVPVTLAAGESMPKDCVAPARGTSGIAAPKNLQVSGPVITQPGTYSLRVSTTNALHEPMYEISLLIDCPGTSLLLRQYILMLDLPVMSTTSPESNSAATTSNTVTTSQNSTSGDILSLPASTTPASAQTATQATNSSTSQRANRNLQSSATTIPAGQAYRVKEGDTLTTIAARIEGRSPNTTWSAARLIFSTNSHAFIRNNPDLIKLGSLIDIPNVAELTGLETGHVSMQPDVGTNPTPARTETVDNPLPTPAPAPVETTVTESRPEVFVTEPEARQTESATTPAIQNPEVSRSEETSVAESIEATIPVADGKTVTVSPFLDEIPVPTDRNEVNPIEAGSADTAATGSTVTPEAQPAPAAETAAMDEPSDAVNPFLAVLVGLLLGIFLSLAAFRRQLIEALMAIVRKRTSFTEKPSQARPLPVTGDEEDKTNLPDAFETAEAASAFTTHQDEIEALQIGDPAENTYIVESSEVPPSETIEPQDLSPEVIDPGSPDDNIITAPEATSESTDDEMLAMLFDGADQTFVGQNNEIFDPTGGIDTDSIGNEATSTFNAPTVEMPEFEDEENLDLTTELINEFDDELVSDENSMQLEGTAEMSGTAAFEDSLDELPSEDGDEDEDLTQKLQEALTMLESDFDEEFTASQLMERKEVASSLNDPEIETETAVTQTIDKKIR